MYQKNYHYFVMGRVTSKLNGLLIFFSFLMYLIYSKYMLDLIKKSQTCDGKVEELKVYSSGTNEKDS